MRILLIMDPFIPVPPTLYGGIERIVYLLANEYNKAEHNVTLLAGPGSYCDGKTVIYGTTGKTTRLQQYSDISSVWRFLMKHKSEFDLVHNFGRLIYLLPILNHRVKKIMSYQRPVTAKGIRIINSLPNKNLIFTACSNYCVSTGNVAGRWETVYNCIDFSSYKLNTEVSADAPLMFLGRLDKVKGAHTAIQVAKTTGHKLILAGNKPDTADNLAYFKAEIEPLIDNEQVIYIGAVNDIEKNKLLQRAKALLFPIEWDEPFGIVMIEAMACGAPVIAYKRGSVPEVVQPGVNGFIVTSIGEMCEAVQKADTVDRQMVRSSAEQKFAINIIASKYLNI